MYSPLFLKGYEEFNTRVPFFRRAVSWSYFVIPRNQKSRPDFYYYYIRVFLRVYTPTYPSTDDTTFVHVFRDPNDIVNLDSASCVGIMAMLFSDHHESGLSRVVCIGWIVVVYPYMHPVCTIQFDTLFEALISVFSRSGNYVVIMTECISS